MVEHDKFSADLMELEHTLVRQFRVLQSLIDATQKERQAILNGEDTVMRLVEEKEVILDQLGVIEDQRRRLVQQVSLALPLQGQADTIQALLPHLKQEQSTRIDRLAEGITTLASQAREQNRSNHALALVRLDWLKATQSLLIGMVQTDPDYRPPGATPASRESSGWGVEIRA